MPIVVLPEEVANQIAAGEVVERPASVVKELVENAIDAEATEIRIELLEGGRRLIRVVDNGTGMTPEDARLALRRHATSKLQTADDLLRLNTLGFRGEALPSIASVSRLELTTRTHDATEGTQIRVEGGKILEQGPVGCPPGTRVTVRDLFYNVPARRKFLKSTTTELTHALQHVQWQALAHPHIRFVLDHQRRTLLDVPGTQDRWERLRLLYGKAFAGHLIGFSEQRGSLHIECYIGDPELTKPNRSFQFFFVNNRPVRDRTIAAAVTQATEAVLPKGRHAVIFLFLTLPPDEVDVNVHPTKAEVRFRSERNLFQALLETIRQGIGERPYVPEVRTQPTRPTPSETYPSLRSISVVPPVRAPYRPEPTDSLNQHAVPTREATTRTSPERTGEAVPQALDLPAGEPVALDALNVQELRIVGTLFATYILAEDGNDLYFIDQHVASERVHYERILDRMAAEGVPSQGLLDPLTLDLTPDERLRLIENRDLLAAFGLELEAFGGDTVLLRGVPVFLPAGESERLVRDLVARMGEDPNPERPWEQTQQRIAATIACHAAVRAGDRLREEEIRQLLDDLSTCRLPWNCPHGRPILIRMSRREIETRFQRR